ncbi:hypothetical protein B0T19DRAFT_15617 [Cercophora scortea]|uniref:C2H2-type domain-containing protein n=1 Tax=Cercophora scortea TaxID=314031 RepID=A0AAE0MKP9_9PEZI|nr:hypothetical protein B0T19DRAFT_15617 [Cercophora scortea]
MMEASSFAARRPGAPVLPAFQLPSPSDIPSTRYHPSASILIKSPNNSSVGSRVPSAVVRTTGPAPATAAAAPTYTMSSQQPPNPDPLTPTPSPNTTTASPQSTTTPNITTNGINNLTPSSGTAVDRLSPSSGVNSSSSQSSQPGGQAMYYPNPVPGSWQSGSSQQSAYTYTNPNSTSASSSLMQSPYSQRSSYSAASPSMPHFAGRSASSATNSDGLPAPPSYQGSSMTSSQSQGTSQQPGLAQPMLSSQNQPGSQPPTPGQGQGQSSTGGPPPALQESGGYRGSHTANSYYPPSSTPQQPSFPSFQGPPPHHSPTAPSPTTSGGPSRALGSLSSGMAPPMPYGGRTHHMPPIGSYSHPYGQMPGPVLSNMHHPGTPMTMVGSMGLQPYGHHGHLPHPPHYLYAHHHPPHGLTGPHQGDRPFKCDQCPQSFNRNHDLKRHKRIHLAVKPFPCTHCEKSFSRKDALKRHRLVKGCGDKRRETREGTRSPPNPVSPQPDRSDVLSDDNDSSSPRNSKKD